YLSPEDVIAAPGHLPKKIIYRYAPSWHRWLCLRGLATPVGRRVVGITCPIHFNHILTQQVHVPHNQCATREIIRSLRCHGLICRWAAIVLATYLDRKDRRSFGKPHAHPWTEVVCRIRTKCLSVRQVHTETHAIPIGSSPSGVFCIREETGSKFQKWKPPVLPSRRHLDNPPVHPRLLSLFLMQTPNFCT